MGNLAIVLLIYVLLSSLGFVLVKKSDVILSIEFFIGNGMYVLGYVIWTLVILKKLPLSIAFPVASAGLLIVSQLAGWYFFHERMDGYQAAAISFMLVGLSMLLIRG